MVKGAWHCGAPSTRLAQPECVVTAQVLIAALQPIKGPPKTPHPSGTPGCAHPWLSGCPPVSSDKDRDRLGPASSAPRHDAELADPGACAGAKSIVRVYFHIFSIQESWNFLSVPPGLARITPSAYTSSSRREEQSQFLGQSSTVRAFPRIIDCK